MAQGSRTTASSSPRRVREGRRLNRADQQAMEIRRRETAQHLASAAPVAEPVAKVDEGVPVIAGDVAPGATRGGATAAARRRRSAREVSRSISLTRDQEYRFIRSDLRRLFILSAVLVVLMIVALVIVEAMV